MAGLVPAIHAFDAAKVWMRGTGPGMTPCGKRERVGRANKRTTFSQYGNYFFTSGHAGSGGPNASSPEIFARIL